MSERKEWLAELTKAAGLNEVAFAFTSVIASSYKLERRVPIVIFIYWFENEIVRERESAKMR